MIAQKVKKILKKYYSFSQLIFYNAFLNDYSINYKAVKGLLT